MDKPSDFVDKLLVAFRNTSVPQASSPNPQMFCEHPVMLFIPYELLQIGLPLLQSQDGD
ncbi:MAG: hypothetical protein MJZ08_06155 [Bacteroidaceae bacterium]|nr:hypothetical protein [Bacteroidaceae bacterium]